MAASAEQGSGGGCFSPVFPHSCPRAGWSSLCCSALQVTARLLRVTPHLEGLAALVYGTFAQKAMVSKSCEASLRPAFFRRCPGRWGRWDYICKEQHSAGCWLCSLKVVVWVPRLLHPSIPGSTCTPSHRSRHKGGGEARDVWVGLSFCLRVWDSC